MNQNIPYILLKGKMDSGKSTTVREVLKKINIKSLVRINYNPAENIFTRSLASISNLENESYIIELENTTYILVMAGAPTEQKFTVTQLVNFVSNNININISLLIISMRSRENINGFNTEKELEQIGHPLLVEEINRIDDINFMKNNVWISRISRILAASKKIIN